MSTDLDRLVQKDAIIEVIDTLFIATDARDWNTVVRCFHEEVKFDMTSLAGGEPQILSPQRITEAWEAGLGPLRAIHHQAGNYQVTIDGKSAIVFCNGVAWHYLPTKSGNDTRSFVGTYEFHLSRYFDDWVIDSMKFNLKFVSGNRDLEAEAL